MKRLPRILLFAVVFGCGLLSGLLMRDTTPRAQAARQQVGVDEVSADTLVSYQKFRKASTDLSDSLNAESLNVKATEDLNYFAMSVGGIDAVKDLEEGRGVDPETFAAIYADRASPEVTQHIDTDELGRMRYKGTVIRIYSRQRLREVFQRRDQIGIRASRND